MQIYLTAKSRDGQNYAKPRVVLVNDLYIHVVPGGSGSTTTKVEEYNANGAKVATYEVYESPAEIQAQSLVADGQATNIYAKAFATTGAAAAGANAAAATDVTKYITEFTSATATTTDGVQLDAATAGKVRVVINNATAALEMWPQTGENFKGSADDAAIPQAVGARKHYVCLNATEWIVADDYTQN